MNLLASRPEGPEKPSVCTFVWPSGVMMISMVFNLRLLTES